MGAYDNTCTTVNWYDYTVFNDFSASDVLLATNIWYYMLQSEGSITLEMSLMTSEICFELHRNLEIIETQKLQILKIEI